MSGRSGRRPVSAESADVESIADVNADTGLDPGVDEILAEATVIVMAGPGGVGKTTVGAALGLRAAQVHGRRAVVVTVDPARRLAEALGVAGLTEEPVLVPVGPGAGRLWVVMVDMAKSWDELVTRHAPSSESAERLMANGLYRTLTRRFVQSHDYIALDHLCDLVDESRYDLVVVDTPPSDHAIDLLDAPGRMIEFFEGRLLRWLIAAAPATGDRPPVAARPLLAVAERLLGQGFLGQIGEFFALFAELRPAFVSRAREVQRRLADDATRYAVVSTTAPGPVATTDQMIEALVQRGHPPDLLMINRLVPTLRLETGPPARLEPSIEEDDLNAIETPTMVAAVTEFRDRAEQARLPTASDGWPVVGIPWRGDDLTDLDQLAGLLSER